MSQKSKAPLGASLVVTSSIFYASYGIWTKLMGSFFDGYSASFYRSIFVLVILLPIALLYHAFEPLRLKQNWRYIVGMLLAALFVWGPLYYAIQHVGVGISLTINYAAIVLGTFFFGWLFAKEQFTRDKFIAAALGIIGLILIFTPSSSKFGFVALSASVVSGLCVAANTVFSKKIQYHATQATIFLWITSVISNGFMSLLFSTAHVSYAWHKQWFYLVCFAVASVAASWLLVRGVKLIDAGAAGVLGLLEIVFGILFGMVFFHERQTFVVVLGVLSIIAAAAIPYVKDYNANRGTLE